jgi:YebC/PmpR family DNA-binding regulatory protein
MAGHSHGANIKFRKDRVDAKKARNFARLARMITVAARGGGDPDANAKLRLAIEKARVLSMPKEVIERAIKKGSGGGETGAYEEVLYEGYAPSGVAVLLEILTDNRHRTAAEIRLAFDRFGGNLGAGGSVAWMFDRAAVIRVASGGGFGADRLLEFAAERGAEEFFEFEGGFEIRCAPSDFDALRSGLLAEGLTLTGAEIAWLPKTVVRVEGLDEARRVLSCLDALDENDDVQAVASNYEFPDEVLAALAAGG